MFKALINRITDKPIKAGSVFGMITVIEPYGEKRGRRAYLCKCECGNLCFMTRRDIMRADCPNCGCLTRYSRRRGTGGE